MSLKYNFNNLKKRGPLNQTIDRSVFCRLTGKKSTEMMLQLFSRNYIEHIVFAYYDVCRLYRGFYSINIYLLCPFNKNPRPTQLDTRTSHSIFFGSSILYNT